MLNDSDLKKKAAGEKAASFVEDGMTIGLGSGSTFYWAIKTLGEFVSKGMNIKGIPSSKRTEKLANDFGIPLTSFSEVQHLDLTIDGADEVDPSFNLVKGGGGALLREKMVAAAADKLIIAVDDSKLVDHLGAFPLPVEVVPFGWETTVRHLSDHDCSPVLRKKNGEIFITDNGNYIADCQFHQITSPEALHQQLKMTVGVVETGLFIRMADLVVAGGNNGVAITKK